MYYKILSSLFILLLVYSCNDNPEPHLMADGVIQSSTGNFELDNAGVLFNHNNGDGFISLFLQLKNENDQIGLLEFSLGEKGLIIENPITIDSDTLAKNDDALFFGTYAKTWDARTADDLNVNITEVSNLNSTAYVSLTFSFTGCSAGGTTPLCHFINGSLTNVRVYQSSESILLSFKE